MPALGRRAGEHDHLHVGVGGHVLDRGVERHDQLAVEHVAAFGTVEGDGADPVGDVGNKDGAQIRSMTIAGAIPPAAHMVISP